MNDDPVWKLVLLPVVTWLLGIVSGYFMDAPWSSIACFGGAI